MNSARESIGSLNSVNPATEDLVATFEPHDAGTVAAAIGAADSAFRAWRKWDVASRAVPMRALANSLRERSAEFARLITREMGKPISEAVAEIEKCAWTCDFYADNAEDLLRPRAVVTNARESFVSFGPLGVVLAVMPWNYPFWQVVRFLAPTLMAGNAALLKHSSNVSLCALALEDLVRNAGFPPGLLGALLLPGRSVEPLIADDRIRAVTFTGSSTIGARLASLAGSALKKTVLELGGSDPLIVLNDSDLPAAVSSAVRARFMNAGQSCIAAKRLLIEKSIAADFERLFIEGVLKLRMGDPLDSTTDLGPLARPDLRDALEQQVSASVALGARVVLEGGSRSGRGWFYRPTILANATQGMPVVDDETFGPLAVLVVVADADEAVHVANSSRYGLGAAIWTRDLPKAKAMARHIESGSVFINGTVASDPRLPFGGVKRSGYGRELSTFGIEEFVNVQSTWVGPDG